MRFGGRVAFLLRHRSRALENLRDAHHDLVQDVPGIVQRAVDEYQQVEGAHIVITIESLFGALRPVARPPFSRLTPQPRPTKTRGELHFAFQAPSQSLHSLFVR